ncbi:MAG: nodulation protein NfeD [Desulfobacteraceae bacterium]|nr:nodulation protein NfeD [Desulfobacteraceae bacterium]MBC2749043.1 nodulation protein NfeD [Desulfobacteraceae bacterium]
MRPERLLLVLLVLLLAIPGHVSAEETAAVHILKVAAPIGPGVAGFVADALAAADREKAACIVIQLDTPGGLAESMRQIVTKILATQTPVIVFVAPSGARAASAGVMITMAADIAAMAPGTNIGAAHPVGAGGKDIDETMSEKVVNDMVAQARSVAQQRGRNADWVEEAIRDSVSITETEALRENVIDLVADDLDALLTLLDGRRVKSKGTLALKDAPRKMVAEGLRTKVLRAISDPNIAFILFLIGAAGLYFELSHPGAIFPGVIGGLCLILAIYAFQVLPVNFVGILLMVLAVIFFILEIKVTSYGMLSVAGTIALFLGGLMLFKESDYGIRVSLGVLVPAVGAVSVFFAVVAGLAFKAQVAGARTGLSGLIGEIGIVKQAIDPEGKVAVHGELWKARADAALAAGQTVRVVAVDGLTMTVEATDSKA